MKTNNQIRNTLPTKQFWNNGHYGIRSATGFDEKGFISGSQMAQTEEIVSEIEEIINNVLHTLKTKETFNINYEKMTEVERKIIKAKIKAINKDRKGTRKEIIDKVKNLFEL